MKMENQKPTLYEWAGGDYLHSQNWSKVMKLRGQSNIHLFSSSFRRVYKRDKEIKHMKDAEFIENNVKVVEEFRANGGKIAGGAPLILMTTKGAKTGQERVYPLMAVPYDDSYLAVASKGGAPKHPQWYHNLMAHPDITVEVGTEKFPARAKLLSGEERAKAYAQAAQVFPPYSEFQQKTAREMPVFLLKRVKEDA